MHKLFLIIIIISISCTKKETETINTNRDNQFIKKESETKEYKQTKNQIDIKKFEEQKNALEKIDKERDCLYKIYIAVDKPENKELKKSLCKKQYNNEVCHSIKSELLEDLKTRFCKK